MMETSPALTAEEWAKGSVSSAHRRLSVRVGTTHLGVEVAIDNRFEGMGALVPRHATAALCLHNQPFGFTWEDVDSLDAVLDAIDDDIQRGPEGVEVHLQPKYEAISSLRSRIQALLPPKESS